MCGRFAQFHSRDEFLAALAPDTASDWHARYNVAPGTPVPMFHHHDSRILVVGVRMIDVLGPEKRRRHSVQNATAALRVIQYAHEG
ncbi:hypothetical protein B1H39_23850 [Serratia marcescens]|nr:hypothetical protein B1H39_23850 [Serratia marcescens]